MDYPSMEPHTITISGGAHVNAAGGASDVNKDRSVSMGCAANNVIVKDNSSLEASSSTAQYSYGLALFNWEDYGGGTIELSGGSSITANAFDLTYGVGVTGLENLKPVPVKMDKGCTFTAEGAMGASTSELTGVSALSDGKTVTYNSEKIGYVDADGNIVKKASFEPLETASTNNGGGSLPHTSSSGSAATAKPTASPKPTAVPDPDATAAPAATDKPQQTSAPAGDKLPFTDVNENDWFYGAVKAVYTEGIMNGASVTEFEPDSALTRGMLATIIGRMSGERAAASQTFTDVDANAYYAPYVGWAAGNGIVLGFGDGTFGPDISVTREQTAAILYRYMKYIGADVSVGESTSISGFADADKVSEYAVPAIQWAYGAGIMKGYPDNMLAPSAGITRAELASMISAIALR